MHQSSNEPNTNKASGHGAQEAYVIYRHTLDIPSITQHKIEDSARLKAMASLLVLTGIPKMMIMVLIVKCMLPVQVSP